MHVCTFSLLHRSWKESGCGDETSVYCTNCLMCVF